MKILALETTEAIGSVAALCDDKLLYQLQLNPQLRSAQALAPGLKTVLEEVGWRPTDIELVAVTMGPGSFTGLRVGVTTAKTLAYCARADVLGISTLETIALQASAEVETLSTAVDAQRGQVIAALFHRGADGWLVQDGPAELVDVDAWFHGLPRDCFVAGPVLRKLTGRVPEHINVVPAELWGPVAASVGRLAAHYHGLGRRDELWKLLPHYSRPSAAEEKWQARRNA